MIVLLIHKMKINDCFINYLIDPKDNISLKELDNILQQKKLTDIKIKKKSTKNNVKKKSTKNKRAHIANKFLLVNEILLKLKETNIFLKKKLNVDDKMFNIILTKLNKIKNNDISYIYTNLCSCNKQNIVGLINEYCYFKINNTNITPTRGNDVLKPFIQNEIRDIMLLQFFTLFIDDLLIKE